jgi:hypothetical protein
MNKLYLAIGLASVIVLSIILFAMPSGPKAPTFPEGTSVECRDGTGMVYRYTGGQLRYYPNPPTAASWNPQWARDIQKISAEECSLIPKGPVMSMR